MWCLNDLQSDSSQVSPVSPCLAARVQWLSGLITLSGSSRCKLSIKKPNCHPSRWTLRGFSKHVHQVLHWSWWKCLIPKHYNRCLCSYYCFYAETSTPCTGAIIITTPIRPHTLWLTLAGMVSRCLGSCLMVKSAPDVHYHLCCSLFFFFFFLSPSFSRISMFRKCAYLCSQWLCIYLSAQCSKAYVPML